jgi:hypothetical protein
MQPFRVKLNVAVFIKSFDRVATSHHTLEEILCAHFVHDARRVFSGPVSNDLNPVSNLELLLRHKKLDGPKANDKLTDSHREPETASRQSGIRRPERIRKSPD